MPHRCAKHSNFITGYSCDRASHADRCNSFLPGIENRGSHAAGPQYGFFIINGKPLLTNYLQFFPELCQGADRMRSQQLEIKRGQDVLKLILRKKGA